ncbi:hypothetical protein EDD17DRAFT_1007855 [Pisolithus thermaeus]|nr:hypothetical protein EV401DRAFT_471047 [Pisolithus croceorrhizus]KAI6158431.1 hypothetical protein EDD17DRAFT_1007855 [Pisolithus thermaeus]
MDGSPERSGPATLPPNNTLSRPVPLTTAISYTTQTSRLFLGYVSSKDNSAIRSPTLSPVYNSRNDKPLSLPSTFGIGAISSSSTFLSQLASALPGNSLSTPTMPPPPNDASTTATLSGSSQSSSQVNAPVNEGGHTASVGLIVALALVGCLLVALIVYLLTLRCRRRIHHSRVSSPSDRSVLSTREVVLSSDGLESSISWLAPSGTTTDTGHSEDRSASTSVEASHALDATRWELTCP